MNFIYVYPREFYIRVYPRLSDERTELNEPLVYLLFLPRATQSS